MQVTHEHPERQRTSIPNQVKSTMPTQEETMQQLQELQYMVGLGMKKRPK